jgi:hypothetical protein
MGRQAEKGMLALAPQSHLFDGVMGVVMAGERRSRADSSASVNRAVIAPTIKAG